MDGFNKTIWINWFQGWDNAPEIAHTCVKSWRQYNPGWDIKLLSNENHAEYADFDERVPNLKQNNIDKSDLLRVSLLAKHGGVWADSTLFCNKPLDDWILDYKDYFVFTRKDNLMDNWFMMSNGENFVAQKMYELAVDYWKWRQQKGNQEELIWCWQIGHLSRLLNTDQKVRSIVHGWDHIDIRHDVYNQKNGKGFRGKSGHLFTPYMKYFYNPISDEIKNRIDAKIDPVYKLTYKTDTEWRTASNELHPGDEKIAFSYPENSEVNYLLSTLK